MVEKESDNRDVKEWNAKQMLARIKRGLQRDWGTILNSCVGVI
jgi:hypothetical protein